MPKKPKTFLEKMNKNVENNTSIIMGHLENQWTILNVN